MFGKFKIKGETDTGTCHVCGDTGANFHYNGFSCQSCRVFFTRALLRGKPFICLYKEKCYINKETRTNCPACRFQKCKDANMDTRDVGRYKRQGSAVVQYYSKHQLIQHTKKFAQSVALGFQFVKELDSSCPATKFAEILVSLDRMCTAGPEMGFNDLKVNVDISLAEALLSSTSCAPRTSIQFDETTTVENIANLVVSHYCRGMTFLSDLMNAAPEIHRLNINDRLKLARYSLVDTVLLTMAFRQWQKNVRSGLTFFHGVHYEPLEMYSGENQVVDQYCREVGSLMENHVAQIFDETGISEEEFTLLRMVVLFQPPQDISDAGRDVIRHASARYSRILATLYEEKYKKLPPEQRLERLRKTLGVVFHTKQASVIVNQLCSLMSIHDVGGMRGSLTYDIHFRKY